MRTAVLILLVAGALILVARSLLVPGPAPDARPAPRAAPVGPPAATPDPPAVVREEAPPEVPEGAIVVLVTGPDGEPVPRAAGRIWRFPGTHRIRECFAIRDGRGIHVRKPPLPTSIRIEVYGAKGCGPALTDPLGPEAQTVEIRLPVDEAISGVVVDQKEKPVPCVRIEARTDYPEFRNALAHNNRPHASAVTRTDGSFRIGGLGDRDYHLRMLPLTGFEPVNRDGTVPGGTEGVRLVCLRKVDLAFRVLDPDGHPVEGAEVVVHRGGMASYSSPTDGKGRAKFTDFVLKRVSEVEVRPPRDREDLLPFRHRMGLPDDRTIRLEPALPLAGIVRDTDGRSVPEGQVSWRRAGTDDPWNWTIADMDGRFRIPRVPVARIQVGAAAPDYENHPEHDQVRTVDAGREDLAFVVRKTPMIVLRFEDWAEGETGTVRHAVDGRARTGRWGREVGESGIVRLAGLKADDTVSVFVQTSRGRVWVGHGRKPGDRPAVVRGLRESKITGRLIGMPEDPHLAIEAHVFWDLRIRGTIEEDGRFEIVGVPPGTWTIKVRPTHKFGRRWGEAEAPTGGHVEIRLGR